MVSTHHITQYLDTKVLAWSPKTLSAERSRLRLILRAATVAGASLPSQTLSPQLLWRALDSKKPYTRAVYWDSAIRFYDWLLMNGHATQDNPFRSFKIANGRQFKNSYQRERLDLTWDEAVERISLLSDESIKSRALDLLWSGQRWMESCQPRASMIIGKGNKPRPDFRPPACGPEYTGSYSTFWSKLRDVGLKPHTLRKLALTRLIERGGNVADIMEVAGWSSMQTAAYYLQPKEISRLKKLMGNN